MDGSDSIPNVPHPTVRDVIPLAQAYCAKPGNGVGGNLHIVLEDGNTRTRHILYCRRQCVEKGDVDGLALCDLLLRMTHRQRYRVCMER